VTDFTAQRACVGTSRVWPRVCTRVWVKPVDIGRFKLALESVNTIKNDKFRTIFYLTVLLILMSSGAAAAVSNEVYKNDSDITDLFLWSDNPANVTFSGVHLSDPNLAGWTVMLNSGGALVLEGPEVKKSNGKFNIDFQYSVAPFTFQFAEVMYDTVANSWTVEATGNITFNGKKLVTPYASNPLGSQQIADITAHFSPSAAVPIPSSAVLMVSAVGFVGMAARCTPTRKA